MLARSPISPTESYTSNQTLAFCLKLAHTVVHTLTATMGFLNSCWEAFLQITTYAHMLGVGGDQQPLHIPTHKHTISDVASNAATNQVSFTVPGRKPNSTFTCTYNMPVSGYSPCNTASDRGCWLQTNAAGQENYTIHTDYESHWPTGITREVRFHPLCRRIAMTD